MTDPFRLEGPAVISFSGGRTSGYMLWKIVQAHGGSLPPDVVVCFANTGKEMPETLDFVNECGERWGVHVVWLEYEGRETPANRWRVVTYETADRVGKPYEALTAQKAYLPNPVTRFCTSELKIRPMKLFAQQVLGWTDWTVALGYRADEPRRVAKLRAPHKEPFDRCAPLAEAGIAVGEVGAFWTAQPFDLRLPNMNGKTMHGNCDLCFLKGGNQVLSLIREKPERAIWWMNQEAQARGVATPDGALFRSDRPSYADMHHIATAQAELLPFTDEGESCGMCHD
jgi:3'-phosphoadenosine 5'-phosphosulfate sulfotransferase (PAPS reductase)/FAD synthetase